MSDRTVAATATLRRMSTAAVPVEHQRRPVRVMHLVFELSVGGMEVGVVKIANRLDFQRVATSICTFRRPDHLKDELRSEVALFELNRTAEGNDPGVIWALAKLMRREEPDVLHTHGWGTLVEGVIAARLARVPVVVHGEHGTMETRPRNLWLQRVIWKRLDAVLSVSSRLTATLAATIGFPEQRITTIRNGVDTRRFTPARRQEARRALGVSDRELVIGTVGRLLPVKDQRTFIAALGHLKARDLPFRAFIAGDGPLRDELEAVSRELALTEQLTFLGQRADVEALLPGFDVFVLSSESEGLSNVILEAMAAGVPVVATDVGGASELIADDSTGILVPAKNPAVMGDALADLAQHPSRRTDMAARSRERAEREFSLDRMIGDYERFYVGIAGGR
jgi:sugar transferase (PEP-CTERM/EpsH1 system associated)